MEISHCGLALYLGGIISPALLDNLLVLPSGGGEQNLAKIATNYIIGLYLRAKIQLGDLLEVKITGNIAIGIGAGKHYPEPIIILYL